MFDKLRIHGTAASILWGYHTAARLTTWSIARVKGQWTLTATIERADPFMLRRTSLLFTAPHEGARKGHWAWGVVSLQIGGRSLIARLGPPEQ
jgi:hypothetical protein